jgi:NhaP-type Na+/H+ or K+/H+ antiporter
LLDLETLGDKASLLEKKARLALGIGLVGVALRIPSEFPRKNWREMLTLIGGAMVLMWAISTSLVYLILGLPLWMAALIGAIITPLTQLPPPHRHRLTRQAAYSGPHSACDFFRVRGQ